MTIMSTVDKKLIAGSPILHTDDYEATLNYYRDVLGFAICWSVTGYGPGYGAVERDGVEFNISGKTSDVDRLRKAQPYNQTCDIYIYVREIDELCNELKSRGADCIYGPEDQAYGMREFTIRDINGYKLCFGQDISMDPEHP